MFVAYLVSYTGIAMAFGVLELKGSAADAAFVIDATTAASIVVLLLGGLLGMQLRPRDPMYVARYCVLFFCLSADRASVPFKRLLGGTGRLHRGNYRSNLQCLLVYDISAKSA